MVERKTQEQPKQKGNVMSVRYPLAIVDVTSITPQVKTTLQYYRSISALHAQVETNHDVVRLEGKARNAAEEDLGAELVGDNPGN